MQVSEQILIVEDDRAIRDLLAKLLVDNGYRVSKASNGRDMDRELKNRNISLVLLDLMLPGESGDSICKRLRQESNLPIIMLTAKGEEVDKVVGLEIGADDYITKPFSPRELLARVRAVLRRSASAPAPIAALRGETISFDNWQLDTAQRKLKDNNGVHVVLTSAEFDMLQVFCAHAGQVLTRDKILDLTHGRIAGPFERSVDILVSRLRQKIEKLPEQPELITTVRGSGYLFTCKVT
jgi:two-component system, OmpR family, response regulator